MITGDKNCFAIESSITRAYKRKSFLALGFFVIHVGGRQYGVRKSDATMLACSFGEVTTRIAQRGSHRAPFAVHPNAGGIADAYRDAIYAPEKDNESFFGIPQPEFSRLFYSNHLAWAPDGDEAFDDWSHVLQFDVEHKVRLIAFKGNEVGYHHNPSTLKDLWLDESEFYFILKRWRDAFEEEWSASPKISEADDGGDGRHNGQPVTSPDH